MTQSRHGLVHCTCLLLTQSGHAACKYPCDCLIKLAFGPTRSMRARARYFVRDESLPRLQPKEGPMAGRASFILGQEPFRTGLLTIGMPGDPHGIQDWMP